MFLNFDLVRVVFAATVSSMLLSSLFIDVACCVCVTVITFSERNLKIFRKEILKEFTVEQKDTLISNNDINDVEGNGTPLQFSCLGNPMDGGAWGATVHGVARNRTRLSDSDPITVKTSASSLSQCFPPEA